MLCVSEKEMAILRNSPAHYLLQLMIVVSLRSSLLFKESYAFVPSENYFINCGSSSNTIVDYRVFVGDGSSTDSFHLHGTRKFSVQDQVPSSDSPPLYKTARIFTKPSSYEFKIKKKGYHLVRIHLFPFDSQNFNLSSAFFHVSSNGFLLLSVSGGNGNLNFPVVKEFWIKVDDDKFKITFIPFCKSSFAYVNAIEVISAPENFIVDIVKVVKPNGVQKVEGLLENNAFEIVHRINMGGPKITPFNDTLWRTWIPDEKFLKNISISKSISFGGSIKYQEGGASKEIAPTFVYNSARYMNEQGISMSNSSLTWNFPVIAGHRYLVRLHICDVVSLSLWTLFFNVYINGYSAYKDLDISKITGILASPHYFDFVVNSDKSEFLSVSVSPSYMGESVKSNAILNGLEIMKMSNSMKSFVEGYSEDLALKNWGGTGGIFAHCIVGMFAFVTVCVAVFAFVSRKRMNSQEPFAWSHLSMESSEGNSKYPTKKVLY